MKTKNSKLTTIYRFVPMIMLMILIFCFSATPGDDSSEQSGFIVDIISKTCSGIFKINLSPETLEMVHHFVRKTAHFSEYALLAGLIVFAFYYIIRRKIVLLPMAEVITALYAASDEIHQYFVPGRYCAAKDVLIDSMGGLTCVVIIGIIEYAKHKKLT